MADPEVFPGPFATITPLLHAGCYQRNVANAVALTCGITASAIPTFVAPRAGIVTSITGYCLAATLNSYTVTIYKNAAASTATATILNDNTQKSFTQAVSLAFAQGDRLQIWGNAGILGFSCTCEVAINGTLN